MRFSVYGQQIYKNEYERDGVYREKGHKFPWCFVLILFGFFFCFFNFTAIVHSGRFLFRIFTLIRCFFFLLQSLKNEVFSFSSYSYFVVDLVARAVPFVVVLCCRVCVYSFFHYVLFHFLLSIFLSFSFPLSLYFFFLLLFCSKHGNSICSYLIELQR